MELHVDRALPILLSDQLKGQLTYAIMCGELRPGQQLPSVRNLSRSLGISQATVSMTYRELIRDHLTVPKPGVGMFVADIAQDKAKRALEAAHQNLGQLTDTYVRQALAIGYTLDQVRAECSARIAQHESAGHHRSLALIGNFEQATKIYADEIERILQDLNVSVSTLLVHELETRPDLALKKLRGMSLIITVPFRLQRVREILEPLGYAVVAVAFQVTSETRQRLLSIPPAHRLGLVVTYPEFSQSLIEEISSYCLPEVRPRWSAIEDEHQTREMLTQIDVLIYTSGSERVLEWVPNHLETIEYRYAPDPGSVSRLGPLIA